MTGLTDTTSYQFQVRAVNATGDGASSDTSNATAPADETLTITAHATDNAKATLAIGNHSRDWYYKADTAPYASCSAVVSSGTTSASLSDLSSNNSYTFKAYSDSSCTTELAAASALLTKPGKPTTPTVAAGVGSGQLTLSSSVTGTGTLTGWQYQQKEGSDNDFGSWQDISSTSTTLSYTVTGLTDATNYQFKVRAVNATGESAASDASTTTAPADETLTVTAYATDNTKGNVDHR